MKNNKDSQSVRPFGLQFLELTASDLDGVNGGKKKKEPMRSGAISYLGPGRMDFEN